MIIAVLKGFRQLLLLSACAMMSALIPTAQAIEPTDFTYTKIEADTWGIGSISIIADGRILILNHVRMGLCGLGTQWSMDRTQPDGSVGVAWEVIPLSPGFEGNLAVSAGRRTEVGGGVRGAWLQYGIVRLDQPPDQPYQPERGRRLLTVPFPLTGPQEEAPVRADLLRRWFFPTCSPAALTKAMWLRTIDSLTPFQRKVLMAIVLEWEVWALPPTEVLIESPPLPEFNDYDLMRRRVSACRRNKSKCGDVWLDFSKIR
jgi:hypothetical protein